MTSRLLVDKIEGKATSGTINIPNHVIQVVQNIGSAVTTNSSTPTTIASATITIQSGSKVYASCVGDQNNTTADAWNYYRIYRDSTAVSQRYISQLSDQVSRNANFTIFYLDTPNGAGTYTYTCKAWQGTGTIQYGETGDEQAPTMILMEIAG